MRRLLAVMLVSLAPLAARAEDKPRQMPGREATIKFIATLHDAESGAYRAAPNAPLSLRACNGAVKSLRKLGAEVPELEKLKAAVLKCYDPETGVFTDQSTKAGDTPDVTSQAVGVMVALELGLTKEQIPLAMKPLPGKVKTFEDARMAAAAVEAWGLKDVPYSLDPWLALAKPELDSKAARTVGSVAAFTLRLGQTLPEGYDAAAKLDAGQNADGGWGKPDAPGSDLETGYRVMRSFHLLKTAPKNAAGVAKFVADCRNADGGYGLKPGDKSSLSGVYYAVVIDGWLNAK